MQYVCIYPGARCWLQCLTCVVFSTESLSEEIQRGEYFHKLAVLDYDFPVSLLALNTIWDLDEWTTEKHMDGQSSKVLCVCMYSTFSCLGIVHELCICARKGTDTLHLCKVSLPIFIVVEEVFQFEIFLLNCFVSLS